MLRSHLFTTTEKQAPADEVTANAKLLTRGGFVRKLSAGIYGFLPLGLRVLNNISNIIREEMNAIGGQELLLSALVEKKYLDATDRWDVSIGYEVTSKGLSAQAGERDAGFTLGWTHEEVLTSVVKHFVNSYKDLPFAAYQVQTKFRDEKRAQAGLLRGREFLMKDLYSFHASQEDMLEYYEKVRQAYINVFSRCGLDAIYTKAPGGDFTAEHTHEFQVVAEVGEDTILVCSECGYAENNELSELKGDPEVAAGKRSAAGQVSKCSKCGGAIEKKSSIEVGNIFPLGTKYSKAFGLTFDDEKGNTEPVVMGSYGIGVSRLMGTIAEIHYDDAGLVWPESVAPFAVHLLELPGGDGEELYRDLQSAGIEVLYDRREVSPGEKFVEADLLGIPYRAVVSKRNGDKVEVKRRDGDDAKLLPHQDFFNLVTNN